MKTMLRTIMATTTLLGITSLALAAGESQGDGSQVVVWAFLGMCALIVILQFVPLAVMSLGMVKAFFKGKEEHPAEVVIDKQ